MFPRERKTDAVRSAGPWSSRKLGDAFHRAFRKELRNRSIGNSLGKFSPPEVSATEQHAGMKSAQLPHVQVAEREMEDMQGKRYGAHNCQESTQGTGKVRRIMQATCSSPVHLLHGVYGNRVDKEFIFEAKVVKILLFHFQ